MAATTKGKYITNNSKDGDGKKKKVRMRSRKWVETLKPVNQPPADRSLSAVAVVRWGGFSVQKMEW